MIIINRDNLERIIDVHTNNVKKYVRLDVFSKKDRRYIEENLERIIKATPNEFHKIISEVKNIPLSKLKAAFIGSQKSKYRRSGNYSGYNKFSSKGTTPYNAYTLAKALKVNVCPYCNKNYTYTIMKNKKKIVRPQFDHFLSKEKYPILALSFYNLIPSCSDCNASIKGRKEFQLNTHLHPYIDDFNSIKRFTTDRELLSLVSSTDKFDIVFENRVDVDEELIKKANKTIEDFALVDIYNEHREIVLELVDIYRIYNSASIDNLFNETEIFTEKEDILRLITCGYMKDIDLDKRPLSKLIKDISEELEIDKLLKFNYKKGGR